MNGGVFIFGASRGVGFELARLLREAHTRVWAMLRGPSARAPLQGLGVRLVSGDAFDAVCVDEVVRIAGCSAIVSTLGGRNERGERVDDIGNRNVIDAAVAAGVRRLVLVTSIGCGEMMPFMSARAMAAFGDALRAKTRAEDHLRRSGLDYTILRPGGLRSGPPTGQGVLLRQQDAQGMIQRADVAALIARCLAERNTIGQTFAAIDREFAHGLAAEPTPRAPA